MADGRAIVEALGLAPDILPTIATERLAAISGLSKAPLTLEALRTSPRIKRRLGTLARRRLGLGSGLMPKDVSDFLAAYPAHALVRAADLIGMARDLRQQGPVLPKFLLSELTVRHGRPMLEEALAIASRLPVGGDSDAAPAASGRAFGLSAVMDFARQHFGSNAAWIEAALPLYTAMAADVAGLIVARALDFAVAAAEPT